VTKAESAIGIENQVTDAQPMVAALQKTKPGQEGELRSTLESPDDTVIIPPKVTVPSSQPIVEISEQGEPEPDSRRHPPTESENKTVTPPSLAKTGPSQTVVTPLPKAEVMKKADLHQPMETPELNGLETSAADTSPFPPPVSATKQSQPGQEAQSTGWQTSQLNIEPIVAAEQRSATSQSADPGLQQKEKPEKPEPRQSEVRLQPVKEIAKEKTEERIIHRETWLLSQESSRYTIQIMGVRDDALLFDFVNRNQLLEQNEIAYYQTTFQGRPWFQLLYGIYPSKRAAQSAADAFPPKIRKSSPWIRRLSGVQKAIRKHAAQ
jgi:DamX protein